MHFNLYVTFNEERDLKMQGNILRGKSLKERLEIKNAIFRVICSLITDQLNYSELFAFVLQKEQLKNKL